MKHLYKRRIIIVSFAVLCIATIVLTAMLILTTNSYTKTMDELKAINTQLQTELDSTTVSLQNAESDLKKTTSDFEQAVSDLADQIESTVYYMSESTFWMSKFMNADPNNVTYSYVFETVEELMAAIKKNPTEYNGKQVKVLGTIYKDDEGIITVFDLSNDELPSSTSDFAFRYWVRKNKEAGSVMETVISNDIQRTVIESGDYVKMYGTVKISNGVINLINCEYSMIATFNER